MSNLNKIYAKSEAWRSQRVGANRSHPYLHGIVVKRSWVGEVRKKLDVSAEIREKLAAVAGISQISSINLKLENTKS
jgi:hypothetical protein